MCLIVPAAMAKLGKDEEWITKFNLNAFHAEIDALGKRLASEQGNDDVRHLHKIVTWSNTLGVIGFLTMGYSVNIVSATCISLFTFTRWTIIAHHTCHGGFDRCHPDQRRWNRFRFALGSLWRRVCDWFDWMSPEAWNVEHNNNHHYYVSQLEDPDLVERNLRYVREAKIPLFLKYIIVALNMMTWKWFYYAPNTYKELKLAKLRGEGKPIPEGIDPSEPMTLDVILFGRNPFYSAWEFFTAVIGPYLLIHFFVFPLPYRALEYVLGVNGLYTNAIINLALAEVLTNVHSFIAVVTNHTGDDMYRFRNSCKAFSGSFYLRQVLASVDFDMGDDVTDFLHGWLNYQVEHHLWPKLSMLSYQKAAPMVRKICADHGVPYTKQNIFIRLKKTIDIMVGKTSMRWFPEHYEALFIEQDSARENN